MVRVAINGFGRIGRTFMRSAFGHDDFEIVAVNDLGDIDNLAYLLKYDSAYGRSPFTVEVTDGKLVVDGKEVAFLQERDPEKLPWKDLKVDVVVEATGFFTTFSGSNKHVKAGAKRVVISAPAKDEPEESGVKGETVLMGVNDEKLATCDISSNASCTTNAASPIVQILEEALDIEKALLDTIHAYTSTQSLVDKPNPKDFRRGRAAAANIIPTSTGAAKALTKAVSGIPFFDGISVRVPVITGSYVDITFVTKKDTTAEEVNEILRKAAGEKRWKNIFTATDEPLVSSDIIGSQVGSIADLQLTRVVGGNLVKVLAWYDNETSYTATLVEHVAAAARHHKLKGAKK